MDIVFYTHANAKTGFGHASRAAKLAKIISENAPQIKIGFFGEFDAAAKQVISSIYPAVFIENPTARVGVYDRMDDPERPYQWSSSRLETLQKNCESVVFLANSPVLPDLPDEITIVGYKLGNEIPDRSKCYWGLDYVPVDLTMEDQLDGHAQAGYAFVALGGGRGEAATHTVLKAIDAVERITRTDILVSPVNQINFDKIIKSIKKPINILKTIPDVMAPIQRSQVVIASYGHLGYEAIAMGKPVCVVGQKRFQAIYAEELAKRNLCIAAGILDDTGHENVVNHIDQALTRSDELSATAKSLIDGRGLRRTALVICKTFRELS